MPPLPRRAPLAGNCLILQQAGGEAAATPMHVSLSWVGADSGVTPKRCLGSGRGAVPRESGGQAVAPPQRQSRGEERDGGAMRQRIEQKMKCSCVCCGAQAMIIRVVDAGQHFLV